MIHIVADTLAGLPEEISTKLGITILPQMIVFGDQSFRDDTECRTEKLLDKMQESSNLPTTAAPPPHFFYPIYEQLDHAGDSILVVAPSSKLSGTYANAMAARAEYPHLHIHVFDSLAFSAPQAVMVLEAQRMATSGADIHAILATLQSLRSRFRSYIILDTLEYLKRSGRIGGAAALAGSLLRIKPILTVRDGAIKVFEKHFTQRRVVERIFSLVTQECPNTPDAHLCVMQCQAVELARELAAKLSAVTGIEEVPVYGVSSAIVVHGGPGILAVTYFVEP